MQIAKFASKINPYVGQVDSEELESPFRLSYTQPETVASQKESETFEAVSSPFKEELLVSGEGGVPEQPLEKDFEFELFASQVHDTEFEEALAELAGGAEAEFSRYTGATQLEQALVQPDFDSKFDQFFDSEYGPMTQQLEMEMDRLSSYLSENIRSDMDFDKIEGIIENFQVAEPELFFGRIKKAIKKIGKGIAAVAKKGLSIAKKVALGPLGLILSKIIGKMKPYIRPFLKRILKAGLGRISPKYRGLVQKALKSLKLGEFEALEMGPTEMFELETYGEPESEDEMSETLVYESPSEEAEVETYYQEFPAVGELENEFDRQMFELAEAELSGSSFEGFTQETFEAGELLTTESETVTLENARDAFIGGLSGESPDVEKLTEDFIPAILVALRLGIRLIGRKRVVNTIAKLVATLIGPLVGKKLASPLSQVIVDVGLKMMSLETSEPASKEQVVASTVANVITETVEKVSEFPQSVLEAEDEVLQSFIQEALMESMANNFPPETLKEESLATRQIPTDANWILRNKGKYKVLSKKYQLALDPGVASRISTLRRGEKLRDVLRRQSWDGKSPISVTVRVFEAVPGTRLSMIAKDYLGKAGSEQLRQILPLTRKAATLLLQAPELAIRKRAVRPTQGRWHYTAGRRFYIVKITKPSTALAPPGMGKAVGKSDEVGVKFIAPKTVLLGIYLNEETSQTMKNLARNKLLVQLSKSLVNLLLEIGSKSIHNLLTKLKIPASITKRIIGLLVKWVEKNLNAKAKELTEKFVKAVERPAQGVTVKLTLELPFSFADLRTLNLLTFGGILRKAVTAAPQAGIEILPGYRL